MKNIILICFLAALLFAVLPINAQTSTCANPYYVTFWNPSTGARLIEPAPITNLFSASGGERLDPIIFCRPDAITAYLTTSGDVSYIASAGDRFQTFKVFEENGRFSFTDVGEKGLRFTNQNWREGLTRPNAYTFYGSPDKPNEIIYFVASDGPIINGVRMSSFARFIYDTATQTGRWDPASGERLGDFIFTNAVTAFFDPSDGYRLKYFIVGEDKSFYRIYNIQTNRYEGRAVYARDIGLLTIEAMTVFTTNPGCITSSTGARVCGSSLNVFFIGERIPVSSPVDGAVVSGCSSDAECSDGKECKDGACVELCSSSNCGACQNNNDNLLSCLEKNCAVRNGFCVQDCRSDSECKRERVDFHCSLYDNDATGRCCPAGEEWNPNKKGGPGCEPPLQSLNSCVKDPSKALTFKKDFSQACCSLREPFGDYWQPIVKF